MSRLDNLGEILDGYECRENPDLEEEKVDGFIGIMYVGKERNYAKELCKLELPIKQKIIEAYKLAGKDCTTHLSQEASERYAQLYEVLEKKYDEGSRLENWLNTLIEAWKEE